MNYITVRVKFPSGASTYDYGAPDDFDIVPGDIVVVRTGTLGNEQNATVVEVLRTLTTKTTRGIVAHKRNCSAVDEYFRTLAQERTKAIVEVNKILEQQKYALAAEQNPELGRKLKELGLL